jgi:hypothetical protein
MVTRQTDGHPPGELQRFVSIFADNNRYCTRRTEAAVKQHSISSLIHCCVELESVCKRRILDGLKNDSDAGRSVCPPVQTGVPVLQGEIRRLTILSLMRTAL